MLILMRTGAFMKDVFEGEGPEINKRIIEHEKRAVSEISEFNRSCLKGHDLKLKKFN